MNGLAAVQMTCVPGDLEANLALHRAAIAEAASRDARLVVFPELSLTGYELELIGARPELTLTPEHEVVAALQAAAAHGVTAIAGSAVAGGGGRQLAAVVVGRDEGPVVYAKQHIDESEAHVFDVAGIGPVVLDDVAVAICRDTRFPAHAAAARAAGGAVYAAGAAFAVGEERMVADRMRDRARETGMWVVLGQHVGPSGSFACCGGAGVWAPDGTKVADAGHEAPGVVVSGRRTSAAPRGRRGRPPPSATAAARRAGRAARAARRARRAAARARR